MRFHRLKLVAGLMVLAFLLGALIWLAIIEPLSTQRSKAEVEARWGQTATRGAGDNWSAEYLDSASRVTGWDPMGRFYAFPEFSNTTSAVIFVDRIANRI